MLSGFILGVYACIIVREVGAWRAHRRARRRPTPPAKPHRRSYVLPDDWEERLAKGEGDRWVTIEGIRFVSADDLVDTLSSEANRLEGEHLHHEAAIVRSVALAVGEASISLDVDRLSRGEP